MAKQPEVVTEESKSTKAKRTQWTVPSESKTSVSIQVPDTFTVNGKSYPFATFSGEVLAYLLCHGLGQKVGDAAAMTQKEMEELGSPEAVQAAKWEACQEQADKLAAGDLSRTRTAGGGGGLTMLSVAVMVANANALAKGKSYTQKEIVELAKKYIATDVGNAAIAAEMASMKAKAAAIDIEM